MVLAVGGGKGGTGKSVICTQLGVVFAQMGYRVVLVDADRQGANLHTFFGLEDPAISFEWIFHAQGDPNRAILPSGVKRLGLFAGLREEMLSQPDEEQMRALAERLRQLDADIVLWDVGSGSELWQTILFERADCGLLVSSPSPTSIEKDYRFFRHVCRWRLAEMPMQQSLPASGWLPVPWLASVMRVDMEQAHALQAQLRRAPLLVLINGALQPDDRAVGQDMIAALRRFFGIYGRAVGALDFDERLWLSIRQRRPAVLEYPESLWVEQLQVSARLILQSMHRSDWSTSPEAS